MDAERAKEILGDGIDLKGLVREDGRLEFMEWYKRGTYIRIDGDFSYDELEAIAWAMRQGSAKPVDDRLSTVQTSGHDETIRSSPENDETGKP
jgi:hypothetical protein